MLYCLGELAVYVGKRIEAETYYRESKDSFIQIGDRFASGWPDSCLGNYLYEAGKYDEARQLWQAHQEIGSRLRSGDMIVYANVRKGRIAWTLQDYQTAKYI
jgi:hypothetical protein